MMQMFRRMADTWPFKIMLVLLVFSFGALFNVSDLIGRFSANKTVLTVGSMTVSSRDLAHHMAERLDIIQKTTGQPITMKQAMQAGLIDQILQELVQEKLVKQEADDLGLVVTTKAVSEYITTAPALKTKDGSFDRARFENYLHQVHMSEAQFINKTRQDLIREQLLTLMDTKDIIFPELKNAYIHHYATMRSANVAFVKAADQKVGTAPDAALKEIYDKDTRTFMVPEMRDFEVITIDPVTLSQGTTIDEAAIAQEYQNNKQDYVTPETRKISVISYGTQEEAIKGLKALTDGEALKKDKAIQIDQKTVSKGDDTLIAKAAFVTEKDKYSKPFAIDKRWGFVRVDAIQPGKPMAESDAKKAIRLSLLQREGARKADEISTQVQDAFSGGATVEEVAKKFNLKRESYKNLSLTAKDVDPQILKAVFELESDQETQPIDGGNGKLIIAKLIKSVPAAKKPFDTVKSELQSMWQDQEQSKLAQAKAKNFMETVAKGSSLKDIAKSNGLTVMEKKLNRYDAIMSKDRNQMVLVETLFNIPKLKGVDVAPQESGYMLVEYTKVDPATTGSKELMKDIDTMLQKNLAYDAPNQFMAYLAKKYPVKVDEEALKALLKE